MEGKIIWRYQLSDLSLFPDFKALFESAPALYLVLLPNDPVFTITAVSDGYLAATMTQREAILGKGIFEVFPDNPSDPNADGVRNLGASLRRAVASQKPDTMAVQKYDIQRPAEQGGGFEERFWSPVNSPVFRNGEVLYIIHRVEDVTEFVRLMERGIQQTRITEDLRIQAERMEAEVFMAAQRLQDANRQLRQANEELTLLREQDAARARNAIEKSERRYRTLVSTTSSIVWTRDPGGAFVEIQPSWSAFTGQTWEQYKGWGWLDAIHSDDRDLIRRRWNEAVSDKRAVDIEARLWNATKNAHCYFLGRSVPVLGSDVSIEEWIGTVTDIDDRKRLDEQLRHTAKLESLGILAGGIAHDFNNLLTGILGNASQALEIFAPKSSVDRCVLENIVSAGERATHLTRQMLAYSGKGAFQVREVDLPDLVRGISALVQSSIPKNVHLRLELQHGLPCIEADPGQIQQVVMNLIINGAEAIPENMNGSVIVTTTTQTVDEEYARNFDPTYSLAPGEYVALSVHDSGIGMSEEIKRKIFDPFFTTKLHGRGLGLSAVLGIVRGHKAALRVYSQAGDGTTFKVLFPAMKILAEPQAAPKPIIHAVHTGKILVVDDEELVGKTIKVALERRGYTVALAYDGVEGVMQFRKDADEFALVILDLTMPRMNGEETLRQIRTMRPSVPVILSSGYDQVEATRKFVGKGLASFLQKPFTIGDLVSAVEAALDLATVARPDDKR